MTNYGIRGASYPNTLHAIANLAPFRTSGALSGYPRDHYRFPYTLGAMPPAERERFLAEHPAYVVYSYETPIAWWSESRGWTVSQVRYSVTSGRHRSVVQHALAARA